MPRTCFVLTCMMIMLPGLLTGLKCYLCANRKKDESNSCINPSTSEDKFGNKDIFCRYVLYGGEVAKLGLVDISLCSNHSKQNTEVQIKKNYKGSGQIDIDCCQDQDFCNDPALILNEDDNKGSDDDNSKDNMNELHPIEQLDYMDPNFKPPDQSMFEKRDLGNNGRGCKNGHTTQITVILSFLCTYYGTFGIFGF